MQVARVLNELGKWLTAGHHDHALAGALALHAYWISRFTADVDLIVPAASQGVLLDHMNALGYETLYISDGFSNHLHPDESWGRVDFIYLSEATATTIFTTATTATVFGVRIPVPRPEHLIAMKLHAIHNDVQRTRRDLADIDALMRLPAIDLSEVRNYFEPMDCRGTTMSSRDDRLNLPVPSAADINALRAASAAARRMTDAAYLELLLSVPSQRRKETSRGYRPFELGQDAALSQR